MVAVPLLKVPLAPLPGAAKVTLAPDTGLPKASLTVTTSGAAKAVVTVALWGVPDVAAMLAAAPAVLGRSKDAGGRRPGNEGWTLVAAAFGVAGGSLGSGAPRFVG